MSKQSDLLPESLDRILDYVNPGDLVVLGSRPQNGKTRVAAGLIAAAKLRGNAQRHFFTLVEREETIRERIEIYLDEIDISLSAVNINCSDNICAETIMNKLKGSNLQGALIVIDYLQVLDERRINPTLQNQLESLSLFAIETGCIILFIAQLSRSVVDKPKVAPTENDIRLPNPLDLRLVNKLMFLYKLDERQSGIDSHVTRLCIRKPHKHEFSLGSKQNVFDLEQ